MTDPSDRDRTGSEGDRRSVLGYRSRLERRTFRLAERRRRAAARFWCAAAPVLVVVATAVALLAIYGGGHGQESAAHVAETTTTALPSLPATGSGLLVIEEEGVAAVAVLMHPRQYGGVVLAIPGGVLLRADDGYKTLADLFAAGGGTAVDGAVTEALAVPVGAVASVEWSDLKRGMSDAGIGDTPAALPSIEDDASDLPTGMRSVARSALALFSAIESEWGGMVWVDLELQGDADGFIDAVAANASAMSVGGWEAAAMTGAVRSGEGFAYVEPDMTSAQALLVGAAAGAAVSLDIQNGSGALGVAEAAGALLEPLGYVVLPYSNAVGFPDVLHTEISFAADAAAEAEAVRGALGVGTVARDDALASGCIVVVLGKDFSPQPAAGPGSAE